ncbi:Ribokinase-like protein [Scheffersomyces amazonensis]|uniref:Ribokinase-like protein n=1 Tax=Scheffersomyces amazonensis TaxID=1078765 RepID=UPI00315DB5B7
MSKSVLSIQSHVVHGYVGGKAAIFPLQTQGWEVDNINTVNFSNHTGYGSFKGTSIDESNELKPILHQLFHGLHIPYTAVLTGYVPNSKLIACIGDAITELKSTSQNPLLYLLDPVMGDNNYLYVDESCITQYRSFLDRHIVDIITPNQFELELLIDSPIKSVADLKIAMAKLHLVHNIKYVVITSLNASIFDDQEDSSNSNGDGYIYCACSSISAINHVEIFKINIIKSYFTGVGDLFSALLLDKLYTNLQNLNDDVRVLSRSVNQVLTIMSKTLKLTHSLGIKQFNQAQAHKKTTPSTVVGKINDADSMKYFELKIIQARPYYDYDGPGEFTSSLLKVDL